MRNSTKLGIILALLFLSLEVTPSRIPTESMNYPFILSDNGDDLSIILMIGDGMGFEHVNISRLVEKGLDGPLVLEQLDFNSSVMTYSANAAITDSAASGTAMATGVKTNNGMIAMNPSEESLTTILEIANASGKATGLVSTTYIQHATPAAFMTHVESRNDITEITRQIVEEVDVDVLLGGGASYFSSSQLDTMETNGFEIVDNRTAMLDVTSGKLLGLFSGGHMDYEIDRDFELTPSLAEMTNKSIEILSQDPDGFFLMVEGGRIDHAGHANNKVNVALDTIAFDNAVDIALQYVQDHENTILIVTADHETGGLSVLNSNLNETLPSESFSEERNRTLRVARANNVSVSWSTDYHTDTPVPLYAYGKAFENLTSGIIIDNIDIFDMMKSYYAGEEITLTNFTHIRIDSPEDVEYEVGSIDNKIAWSPYDPLPDLFAVLLNDTDWDSGPWNGSIIIVSIDGLDPGVHNFTIIAQDTSDNEAIDTVIVTVVDTTSPSVLEIDDIEYEAGSGGLEIIWTAEDACPDWYVVLKNSSEYASGPWITSEIIISVSNLNLTTYNFTLIVNDTSGQIGIDTVFVFVNDSTNPIIDEPIDINYEAGSTDQSIIWHPEDLYPDSYSILRNGSELISGPWNGSKINISISGLDLGMYNYTLFVNDTVGNYNVDTVIVTVVDTTSPSITNLDDIDVEAGSGGFSIIWVADDLNPDSFIVLKDGSEYSSGPWDGSEITVNVNTLDVGIFNFTLLVNDTIGNVGIDTVLVNVEDTTKPIVDRPGDIQVQGGPDEYLIQWSPEDLYPDSYSVLLNGTEIIGPNDWNGSAIIVSYDGLTLGVFNYSLIVRDESGNWEIDTVIVSIIDSLSPAIEDLLDIEYETGTTGNWIVWNATEVFPSSFVVMRNGSIVSSGMWNGSEIRISIDGLALGIFNYSLFLNDTSGNAESDSVFVFVVDTTVPTISNPFDIVYTEGQTGNMISWTAEDLYPSNYEIYVNDSLIKEGFWNSSIEHITINADGLSPATYEFRIRVSDTSGNTVTDIVIVVVQPEPITSTATTTTTTTSTIGTQTETITTTTTNGDQILYITGVMVVSLALILSIGILLIFIRKRYGS